jgi:hypothetical protein
VGDVGAVTLHAGQHDLVIEHLLSESPVTVEARGRVVEEWRLTPGRENHLLDTLTMAAVAASITGISAVGAEPLQRKRRKVEIPQAGQRRRIEVKRLR